MFYVLSFFVTSFSNYYYRLLCHSLVRSELY